MVLNGKAELAADAARAANVRYEKLELIGIVIVLSISGVLSGLLYYYMEDGWQENEGARLKVLLLSITLLMMSLGACMYIYQRLYPTVRLQSAYPTIMPSVNSQLCLVGSDRPPSYDAVTRSDVMQLPPPSYNAVFNV